MNDKSQWDAFRDNALAQVRDIEDLVKIGESLNTCPYYGSRHALKSAQVVAQRNYMFHYLFKAYLVVFSR